MASQNLLESLNGKFNYPYFKGVEYGEKGECIIQGKYATYPIEFDENNKPSITCGVNINEENFTMSKLELIAILTYLNKFFNPSLTFDTAKDLKPLKSAEKRKNVMKIISTISTVLIVVIIALQYVPSEFMTPGFGVRTAYLTQYSEIGRAHV